MAWFCGLRSFSRVSPRVTVTACPGRLFATTAETASGTSQTAADSVKKIEVLEFEQLNPSKYALEQEAEKFMKKMSKADALATMKNVIQKYGSRRFLDKVVVKTISGSGGSGCVSFLRQKYIRIGPPSGGDGGKGGSVYFETRDSISNLTELGHTYKAESGEAGQGKNRHGKGGSDTVIHLPPGTVIRPWDPKERQAGDVIADMAQPGMRFLAAQGGKGGRGNPHFASSTHRSPQEKEIGTPAVINWYQLELRLIADVGLVGYPNAGKSTLLTVVSNATPKVASYPFTTLQPHLGVVDYAADAHYDQVTVADLPGLIEGAHLNIGLGHEFLRHIERTKVICYVIDMSGRSVSDNKKAAAATGRFSMVLNQTPIKDYTILRKELGLYNTALLERPFVIVANKMDMPKSKANLKKLREFLAETHPGVDVPVIPISALNQEGIDDVKRELRNLIVEARQRQAEAERRNQLQAAQA
eukprot:TRINITY_DN30837_c0_g2_i1.p1 TRINITY_DN30837_c0_g2~~TRINITY_DN30837_c0_g2_i1.p1  ORF type:complete len:472 (+),score=158.72 TRINITY_DN30837_c0_g2_i1:244-1659(+)